jgi:hypothetical protein
MHKDNLVQEVVYLYHIADIVDETINCDRYIHGNLMTILDMRDLNREFFTIFAIQSLHTLFYYAKSGVTFEM